jgi:hypothetical protein
MCLVHELEELVDDRLQELPVRLQEPRVLSDNVHDVGRADSLVVFASLLFGQAEQVLDDGDQETLLGLFVCGRQLPARTFSEVSPTHS